jgi:hypothetical protein
MRVRDLEDCLRRVADSADELRLDASLCEQIPGLQELRVDLVRRRPDEDGHDARDDDLRAVEAGQLCRPFERALGRAGWSSLSLPPVFHDHRLGAHAAASVSLQHDAACFY